MNLEEAIFYIGFPLFCLGLFGAAWTIDLFNLEDRLLRGLKYLLFSEKQNSEEPVLTEKEIRDIVKEALDNKANFTDLISIVDKDLNFSFKLRDSENKNILSYIALIIALGSAFSVCFFRMQSNPTNIFWISSLEYTLIFLFLSFFSGAIFFVYKALSCSFDLPVGSARNIEYYYGQSKDNSKKIDCLARNSFVAEQCIVTIKRKL